LTVPKGGRRRHAGDVRPALYRAIDALLGEVKT
jgi:hypothetical protein